MAIVGLFRSTKEDERRIPLHPEHLLALEPGIRSTLYFEAGYGQDFQIADEFFIKHSAGVVPRAQLLAMSDLAIILKPTPRDLLAMRPYASLCGWVHCVQQVAMTQVAIDQKLSLIALDRMHYWVGDTHTHVFYKNNEIAGEMGVYEALRLCGFLPNYGSPMSAAVISFGAVGRGAVYALKRLGVHDITVYSRREAGHIADQQPGVAYYQIAKTAQGEVQVVGDDLLFEHLKQKDVIVNAIAQDTDAPWMFMYNQQINQLKASSMIVDISCDEGLGFEFAQPTSFKAPICKVGNAFYYSVDHIPSCVWKSASYEVSKALLPFLKILLAGESAWIENNTIHNAIDLSHGIVVNPAILAYQKRSSQYPHEIS